MNIIPGDKVSWTHVSRRGRTISMTLKNGTVVNVMCETTLVKISSGRLVEIPTSKLRRMDEKSDITKFIEALKETK